MPLLWPRNGKRQRLAKIPKISLPTTTAAGDFAKDFEQLKNLLQQLQNAHQPFAEERQQELARIAKSRQQALAQLGDFQSAPRDEEYEYLEEYQERLKRERAHYDQQKAAIEQLWQETEAAARQRIEALEQQTLADLQAQQQKILQQRYDFTLENLSAFRYALEDGLLHCQAEKAAVLPLQVLKVTASAKVPREQARISRAQPQAFALKVQLAFTAEAKIDIVAAQLWLQGYGKFPAQTQLELIEDIEAVASQTFAKVQKEDSKAAYQKFLKQFPHTALQATVKKRLTELKQKENQINVSLGNFLLLLLLLQLVGIGFVIVVVSNLYGALGEIASFIFVLGIVFASLWGIYRLILWRDQDKNMPVQQRFPVGWALFWWFAWPLLWPSVIRLARLKFMAAGEQIFWSCALYLFAGQWLIQVVLDARYYSYAYSPTLAFLIFLPVLVIFIIRVAVRYQNLLSGKSNLAE